jgi:hypothetical protein
MSLENSSTLLQHNNNLLLHIQEFFIFNFQKLFKKLSNIPQELFKPLNHSSTILQASRPFFNNSSSLPRAPSLLQEFSKSFTRSSRILEQFSSANNSSKYLQELFNASTILQDGSKENYCTRPRRSGRNAAPAASGSGTPTPPARGGSRRGTPATPATGPLADAPHAERDVFEGSSRILGKFLSFKNCSSCVRKISDNSRRSTY